MGKLAQNWKWQFANINNNHNKEKKLVCRVSRVNCIVIYMERVTALSWRIKRNGPRRSWMSRRRVSVPRSTTSLRVRRHYMRSGAVYTERTIYAVHNGRKPVIILLFEFSLRNSVCVYDGSHSAKNITR